MFFCLPLSAYNVTRLRDCVTIVAVGTQQCLLCALFEPHITVNYITISNVAQQCFMEILCRRQQFRLCGPVFKINSTPPDYTNFTHCIYAALEDGFGGLVVSILATGTRVRGFKPGRSRWIFRASEKTSVCLPSEGK
jgi:hypothetical protein